MRKEFAKITSNLLAKNDNLVILLGDISVGLFLKQELLPNRVFNMGVLEQSMISFAAGLSRGGILPFVHTISPFIIERAYEQIKLDLEYNQNKVILVSANGPYDYNKLGPTHHCSADVPLLDLMKSINIFLPGRDEDVSTCINYALKKKLSSYIRLTNRHSKLIVKKPGAINKVKKKSKKLNIFIGETISYAQKKLLYLNNDWIYIFELNAIKKNFSTEYQEIIFWEPYSKPIVSINFKKKFKTNKCKIFSNIYPKHIYSGIFHFPKFIKIKI
jgi:transketolase